MAGRRVTFDAATAPQWKSKPPATHRVENGVRRIVTGPPHIDCLGHHVKKLRNTISFMSPIGLSGPPSPIPRFKISQILHLNGLQALP